MSYQDVREWIRKVDELGEIKVVKGADWNLEIGALSVLGVALGVVVANEVSERTLEVAFAALALVVAAQLVIRASSAPERP